MSYQYICKPCDSSPKRVVWDGLVIISHVFGVAQEMIQVDFLSILHCDLGEASSSSGQFAMEAWQSCRCLGHLGLVPPEHARAAH